MPHFHFLLSSAPSNQIPGGEPAVLPGLRASTMDPGSPPLSVLFCPRGPSAGTCPCIRTLPGLTLASWPLSACLLALWERKSNCHSAQKSPKPLHSTTGQSNGLCFLAWPPSAQSDRF